MAIQIIIADNNQTMRQGLKALLEKEPDMEVVAEAGCGEVIVRMVRDLRPEVVIIDVKMPISDGIETTRKILSDSPSTKVIALSMHGDRHFVTNLLKAGAHGYLLKDCAFEELPKAIRLAMSNQTFLSSGLPEIIEKE
jgi:two-component system response regulator NreC